MCDICEMNKKLGIPNYICIEKTINAKRKTMTEDDLYPNDKE